MRPRGTHGDIARAILHVAREPATVRELAERAQVGYGVARYTASRLVDRGHLEVVAGGRPALLQRAETAAQDAASLEAPLVLSTLWWGQPAT